MLCGSLVCHFDGGGGGGEGGGNIELEREEEEGKEGGKERRREGEGRKILSEGPAGAGREGWTWSRLTLCTSETQ